MIFKAQDCFANISATKAPIFMKFETFNHEKVKNYQMICRKNHAHKRHKLVCARFVATKRARARLRFVCTRVCMDLYQKKVGSSLLSYELKFQIS